MGTTNSQATSNEEQCDYKRKSPEQIASSNRPSLQFGRRAMVNASEMKKKKEKTGEKRFRPEKTVGEGKREKLELSGDVVAFDVCWLSHSAQHCRIYTPLTQLYCCQILSFCDCELQLGELYKRMYMMMWISNYCPCRKIL